MLAASKTRKVLAELKAWLSTRKWLTVQLGAHPCDIPRLTQRRVVKKLSHGILARFGSFFCCPKPGFAILSATSLLSSFWCSYCLRPDFFLANSNNPTWTILILASGFCVRVAERTYQAHCVLYSRAALEKLIDLNEKGGIFFLSSPDMLFNIRAWETIF